MWDIDSIIQQHNQYALGEMMGTLRIEVEQSPQPENWALSVLVQKLRTGPPLLSELLSRFTSVEEMSGFLELIMRYLPGREADILKEKGNARLYRFCQLFGREHFPLPPGTYEQSLYDFIRGMPVQLLGMSYTEYHNLNMRPGYILLFSLLTYPYEGDERDNEDDRVPFDPFDPYSMSPLDRKYKPSAGDVEWLSGLVVSLSIGGQWVAPVGFSMIKTANNAIELTDAQNTSESKEVIRRTIMVAEKAGIKVESKRSGKTAKQKQLNGARVALLDSVRQLVGEGLMKQIPGEGWERDYLHLMADGTIYEGLGSFADWVFRDTGCLVLDNNYENCGYSEGDTEPTFRWSAYNVKALTDQWPKVKEIREKIDKLVEYIEYDPGVRFGALVKLLNSQNQVTSPKKKRDSAAVNEYGVDYIELEQVLEDEEEDDDDE